MQYDSRSRSNLRFFSLFLFVLMALSGCVPVDAVQRRSSVPAVGAPIHEVNASADLQISHRPERVEILQTLFAAAALNQDVYGRYDTILIHWPDDLDIRGELTIRIQSHSGRTYLERMFTAGASATARLGKAYVLPEGVYDVVLIPTHNEYYLEGMRIERKIAMRIEAASP